VLKFKNSYANKENLIRNN